MRVLAAAPQPVVLLRDVRELEVEREGAQDLRLAIQVERADGVAKQLPWRAASGVAGERPDPLLVLEKLVTALLDEHAAEDSAEEPDVPAERRGRARRLRHGATVPNVGRTSASHPR